MTTYFGAFNRGEWQPGRQEHVENIRMQDLARGLQQWIAEQQLNQGQQRIGLEQRGLGLQQQGLGLQERGLTQRRDIANQELALRGRDLTRLEGDSAANNAANADRLNMTKQEFAQWLADAPNRKALAEATIRRTQAEADSAYNEAHPPVNDAPIYQGEATVTGRDGKPVQGKQYAEGNTGNVFVLLPSGEKIYMSGKKLGQVDQAPGANKRYQFNNDGSVTYDNKTVNPDNPSYLGNDPKLQWLFR